MAVNAIEGEPARELRSHLESCRGCRQYLAEISNVGERIGGAEVETGIEASPAFHRKVAAALRRQEARPEKFATILRALLSGWRAGVAVSLVLFTTAATLMLRLAQHQPPTSMPGDNPIEAAVSSGPPTDVEPTISNYSAIADRSFEQFDELLTQQANKHFTHYPVYTAGGVSDATLAE